jgi:hypothetical protein
MPLLQPHHLITTHTTPTHPTQYHRTLVLDGHVIGGVEAILDTMTSALQDNPDRTFVYADLAFFVKWWQELHADSRALVRRLVAERRLEFTNGGLVQHDEACSHYGGMVEQMAAGMGFLWREFGVSPRIAWQLDGFGHSRSEPLLKAQGGFDALFFGRSDLVDMEARARARNLELMWRGSEGFGAESDLWVSQYPSGEGLWGCGGVRVEAGLLACVLGSSHGHHTDLKQHLQPGNYGPPSWSWFFERRNDYAKSLADAVKDDPEVNLFGVCVGAHSLNRRMLTLEQAVVCLPCTRASCRAGCASPDTALSSPIAGVAATIPAHMGTGAGR